MCIVSTAIVVCASHTVAVCSCHTLSIVTTTCSVLTSCRKTHPTPCQAIKTEQNQIESRPRSSHPSIGVCVNRNHSQIRIEFDPASRPTTRASLSRYQPRPMCSSSFRLAFQRCQVPVVAFVQHRDHANASAGAERTTVTNVTGQSKAQLPRYSADKICRDNCNDTLPNTR